MTASKADVLSSEISIKLTGTYSQVSTGTPDDLAVTKPLKMADLLELLGLDASLDLEIYWDNDITAFVLAPPGNDGVDVPPTAVIVKYGDSTFLNKSASKSFETGSATVLDENLSAGYTSTYSFSKTKVVATDLISAYGEINGKNVIVRMKIKDTYSNL